MKKGVSITLVVIALLVLVVAVLLISNGSQAPSNSPTGTVGGTTHDVSIMGMAFNPTPLTINVGDTVVWTNDDSVGHTVTSDSGTELSSSTLSNGDTYSHTFTTAGTYSYHCSIHPYMKGTINVQ